MDKHAIEEPDEQETSFYAEEEIPVAATVEEKPITISDEDLELKLKKFRKKTTDESGRKAFHIFTNKTLDELVEKKPTSLEGLRKIRGIGDKKVEEFGIELVGLIKMNK